MAIQNKTLASAEHDWYATRSSLPNSAPLNDHKRAYYLTILTGKTYPSNITLIDLEREFLHDRIDGNSGSAAATDKENELWRKLITSPGIGIDGAINNIPKKLSQLKYEFFSQNVNP